MMLRKGLILAMALAALILLPGRALLAQEGTLPARPEVVFTDRYILPEGATVTGSLVVVAESIMIEAGSTIIGDAALIGERVAVHGEVGGELTALGTDLVLASGSVIGGDANLCGETIRRADNATINGLYRPGCQHFGSLLGQVVPAAFNPVNYHFGSSEFDPAAWQWDTVRGEFTTLAPELNISVGDRLLANLVMSLVVGAIASLFTLVCPLCLRRVSEAALTAPLASSGVGLLSLVVMGGISGLVVLSLVLLVTFCLVPLVGLGWVVLFVALMMGWAAIGLPVGAWLLASLGVHRVSPLAAVSVGTLAVTFIPGLLVLSWWTLPVYLLLIVALGSWGLGAVVLTRFGTQAYPLPVPAWTDAGAKGKRSVDKMPFEV